MLAYSIFLLSLYTHHLNCLILLYYSNLNIFQLNHKHITWKELECLTNPTHFPKRGYHRGMLACHRETESRELHCQLWWSPFNLNRHCQIQTCNWATVFTRFKLTHRALLNKNKLFFKTSPSLHNISKPQIAILHVSRRSCNFNHLREIINCEYNKNSNFTHSLSVDLEKSIVSCEGSKLMHELSNCFCKSTYSYNVSRLSSSMTNFGTYLI